MVKHFNAKDFVDGESFLAYARKQIENAGAQVLTAYVNDDGSSAYACSVESSGPATYGHPKVSYQWYRS